MFEHYKYTDKEKDELIKSLMILVDTREKVNSHITDYFSKKGIAFKSKALSNGDYSFYIPENSKLNIDRDLYFDKEIMIERKHNLEEISGNITQSRARFEEELATFKGKKYLLIENSSYENIVNHSYSTGISPKAFLATLHSYNHRYDLQIFFMPNEQFSPIYIYGVFAYYLKSLLR